MFGDLPGLGRALFLTGALLTHAGVGYALVHSLTEEDPRLGLVAGVVPDVDFLFPPSLGFPFVHRGIVHTPLFVLLAVAAVYALHRRAAATAVGVALASHLLIDGLSPAGIMWLYPVTASPSPGLGVHSPAGTVALWLLVGVLLYFDRRVRVAAMRLAHRLRRGS